jgi:hypothetical protein
MIELPYKIEWFAGPGSNRTAMKVYPSGLTACAAPEEVQVWQYLQGVERELADERAARDLDREREELAARPLPAPARPHK